jgi:uncharacterized protein
MAKDLMGYEAMAQQALRGVVRMSLERAAKQGLPGEHHFYITFDTTFPGVEIAEWLHGRYPEEMTIVLQHQYSGLKIGDSGFEVVLSFQKVGELLVIPWPAIKAFFDPSVQFMLQFTAPSGAAKPAAPPPLPAPAKAEKPAEEEKPPVPPGGGEVVSLDKFRKK